MSEIKVGDRVLNPGFGERTVVAVDGNSAWIRDKDGWQCVAKLSNLTRIEPELVVLTPKYAAGQRLRLRGDHSHIFVADRIEILYQDSGNPMQSWYEDVLEPVPTPCRTCKGSGKASE